ncbi:hypothetical protein A2110_01725 [Candidatus Jorgensenbacteria bacterium GWA1_54_12]|uniref:Glycerate kinase n=1 Tax=Candidatus Jorgensenbacteria bacterium GWA1_54_12 TaxID=1798468 RepID=A0A1F6BKP0_9BACT|nr:MAG: hypothetical protein A2110_01725 [Candidatus Jorgensenbacteria bacterium GWA1_54_12]
MRQKMRRFVRNSRALRKNKLRTAAVRIFEAGLKAVEPARAVAKRVRVTRTGVTIDDFEFLFGKSGRVFVVAVGKCAASAGRALEKVLGRSLTGGVVADIAEDASFRKLRYFKGTHPTPSAQNREASEAIITLLRNLTEEDAVLFVVSGGGSALLYNSDDISPEEEARMMQRLSREGATIVEMNTIRKHLSTCRGGNLAKYAYPARSAALIISDIPSNDIQFVASGPTVRDTTTVQEAAAILEKYRVLETCDVPHCRLLETPKEDKYFQNMRNILFLSHMEALQAMKEEAERLGLAADVCGACVVGESRTIGALMTEGLHKAAPHSALLYGGETTVVLRGEGKGGRNQEFVLSALPHLREGELIASVASDGWDNTPHAGALGDVLTRRRAEELGLNPHDFLERNDSFTFFEAVGDAVLTGRLGSNVADLFVALKE